MTKYQKPTLKSAETGLTAIICNSQTGLLGDNDARQQLGKKRTVSSVWDWSVE